MISILNLEPDGFSKIATSILNSFAKIDYGPMSRSKLLKNIYKYDALIVRLDHYIDGQIIRNSRKLKVISSATTGLNHIDLNLLEKKKIKVISLKGETEFLQSIHATAEHTWALLLSLVRKIPQARNSVLNDNWKRDNFKGHELHGSTLGIVGFGRIGKKVANYALGFGMKVLVFTEPIEKTKLDIKFVDSLEKLISQCNVISIHLPYNSRTHQMFGKREFSSFKNGSYLINTSRGEILEENELINALIDGRLLGAAIDVINNEKSINLTNNNRIISFAKRNSSLLITPHIGGCTFESMEKTEIFMSKKLRDFFKNDR